MQTKQNNGGFMINSKNKTLNTILDSKNGLHLTAYIKFDGNIVRFRKKLNTILLTSEKYLSPVLNAEDKKRFLSPVKALGLESETLKQIKGNIAIFRKDNFFRYMSLPIEVEETCVVANTFHIKPMIKWAQQDQDFLIVGLSFDGAILYKGNQSEFKKIDTEVYPEYLRNQKYLLQKAVPLHTMEWLSWRVSELVKGNKTTVFVAGNKDYVSAFIKNFKSDKLYPETIAPHFSIENIYEICQNVRALLRMDSRTKFIEALKEFEIAQSTNTAKTNIYQIAKAAIKGNVKKLVIAEDLNVFGRLDPSTGGVSIHPIDMDHEDDCLLDDLAQTVLLGGGEVIVAKRCEIPKGRPIVAVLNNQQSELHALVPKRLLEIAV